MPCRDYYDDHPQAYYSDNIAELKKQVSFAESALCLVLNTMEQLLHGIKHDFDDKVKTNPLDILEFEEAGITRAELDEWWIKHKKLDAEHRELERLTKVREAALHKLSDEEKKVLGVK